MARGGHVAQCGDTARAQLVIAVRKNSVRVNVVTLTVLTTRLTNY